MANPNRQETSKVMVTSRIVATGLVLMLFYICFSVNAQASETCRTPTPKTLITWYNSTHPGKPLRYSAQDSMIYHPIEVFQTERPRLKWIGLAWLAPEWGAVFAANCDGEPLAAHSVGAVGKIMPGPELPELGQTIMFIYVGKETRDCVHDSADIVALKDGAIISLWSHAYKQGLNVGAPNKPSKDFITRNYAVTFSNDGQTLRVSGLIQHYPYRKDGSQSPTPNTTTVLPEETYHWDTNNLRFIPEHSYAQPDACVSSTQPGIK